MWIRQRDDGVTIAVKLQPRAKRSEVVGLDGDELKIRVTAPPVDSAANRALVGYLSDLLGCSTNAVQIIKGATSRHKTVWIRGHSVSEVEQILAPSH